MKLSTSFHEAMGWDEKKIFPNINHKLKKQYKNVTGIFHYFLAKNIFVHLILCDSWQYVEYRYERGSKRKSKTKTHHDKSKSHIAWERTN